MKVSNDYRVFYDERFQRWYRHEYRMATDSLEFYETNEPDEVIVIDVDVFKEKIAQLYGIFSIIDDDTISYLDSAADTFYYQTLNKEHTDRDYFERYEDEEEEEEEEEEEKEEEAALVPSSDNDMPSWYTMYKEHLGIDGGRQEGIIRQTYGFNNEEWKQYFCDSSYQTSFIAGHSIAKNILQNQIVEESYSYLKKISIMDIGCGVGGATIGVISAIEELLPNVEEIEIEAYDYNESALLIFKDTIENQEVGCSRYTQKRISFSSSVVQFKPEPDATSDAEHTFESFGKSILNDKKYNFILCFKMINELIYRKLFSDNPYKGISEAVCGHLLENGFFILFDIYKSDGEDRNGQRDETNYNDLLRDQTRQFLTDYHNYRIIIPIPCGLAENCGQDKCITYKLFHSNHEQGRTFPASYRVITEQSFANKILKGITRNPTEYTVMYTKQGAKKKCYYNTRARSNVKCNDNETIIDGYSI